MIWDDEEVAKTRRELEEVLATGAAVVDAEVWVVWVVAALREEVDLRELRWLEEEAVGLALADDDSLIDERTTEEDEAASLWVDEEWL